MGRLHFKKIRSQNGLQMVAVVVIGSCPNKDTIFQKGKRNAQVFILRLKGLPGL
jgi:hypothetical protein